MAAGPAPAAGAAAAARGAAAALLPLLSHGSGSGGRRRPAGPVQRRQRGQWRQQAQQQWGGQRRGPLWQQPVPRGHPPSACQVSWQQCSCCWRSGASPAHPAPAKHQGVRPGRQRAAAAAGISAQPGGAAGSGTETAGGAAGGISRGQQAARRSGRAAAAGRRSGGAPAAQHHSFGGKQPLNAGPAYQDQQQRGTFGAANQAALRHQPEADLPSRRQRHALQPAPRGHIACHPAGESGWRRGGGGGKSGSGGACNGRAGGRGAAAGSRAPAPADFHADGVGRGAAS